MKTLKIIEKKNLWLLISLIVIGLGFWMMFSRSLKSEPILNYGIDFLGGTSLILKSDSLNKQHEINPDNVENVNMKFIESIRHTLINYGIDKSTIQITGEKEVLIKTLQLKDAKSQDLLNVIRKEHGDFEVLEIDFIGPTIGKELKEKSYLIIIFVVLFLLVYITFRFEWVYGVSAILALLHDGLITLSLSSILHLEINTAFVAGLLTVLGYSINDTIVIFDRVRENQKSLVEESDTQSFIALTNLSLSQTLTRTINTSMTTLIVITSLILFGGPTITGFCTVLLIGVISGTYSSLFIASPFVVMFNRFSK
ncbi:protein translocase subunit SecF [Candidatus Marinamargulisbacteria bacterium SCGC AAA071-K20]|nr:protein translocase subunit SecF [Candidatus Marinamargulisbacteria bacterium SCGC AAA071-K20]